MKQGVYGAAQGPLKRQAAPNDSVAAMAPSLPAKRNTLMKLRELVWVGGCVTALAAWTSPPGRRRRSVHKSVEMAPPRRFGAFVYTVATREDRSSDRGDAGVYTNRLKWPLGAVSGHLCTLLRRESRYESRRELRQVARAPQPPRRAGGALSLGREDRLCASGAAARLASSPRHQPTRTPEEPP